MYAKYTRSQPVLNSANSVTIKLVDYYLTAQHLDSGIVPSLQYGLYSVWLSHNHEYESWRLNLLDYFKSYYSKVTLNLEIALESQCKQILSNNNHHYPDYIKVSVFCVSKNGTDYLYDYKLNLSQSLHFNLDILQGYALDSRVLDVRVTANNPITSI